MKKVLAMFMTMIMIATCTVSTFAASGDNTGEDIFDLNMYINTTDISKTEGTYHLGDDFELELVAWVGETLYKKPATRRVTVTGPEAVTGFCFKDGEIWKDITEYNIYEEETYNEKSRIIKLQFNATGVYAVNFKFVDKKDKVIGQADTKYITITEDSYSVSKNKPSGYTESGVTSPKLDDSNETTTKPGDLGVPTTKPGDSTNATTKPEDSDNTINTTKPEVTTKKPASSNVTKPAQAKIKKIYTKKKTSKKVKLTLYKTTKAKGYEVVVYGSSKNAKKNKNYLVKKSAKSVKFTIISSKIKNKKTLYIKARAYVLDKNKNKVYGKWSKTKKLTSK